MRNTVFLTYLVQRNRRGGSIRTDECNNAVVLNCLARGVGRLDCIVAIVINFQLKLFAEQTAVFVRFFNEHLHRIRFNNAINGRSSGQRPDVSNYDFVLIPCLAAARTQC